MFFLLLACNPDAPEDRGPVPWENLEAEPLKILAPLTTLELGGSRLARLQDAQVTLVLAEDAVFAVDARYHHAAEPVCVDASAWSFETDGRKGGCPQGSVELDRGRFLTDAEPVGLATVGDMVWVLDKEGRLYQADGNIEQENPYDVLRLGRAGSLSEGLLAASPEGKLAIAENQSLKIYSGNLNLEQTVTLSANALDIGWDDGGLRVLTSSGLWWEGEFFTLSASRLTVDGESTWLAGASGLVEVKQGEITTASTEVFEGPLTVGSQLYASTGAELVVLDRTGTELARETLPDIQDLLITPTQELLVLTADQLQVFLNEQALQDDRPPLYAAITAFIERPRKKADDVDCKGEESVEAFVGLALQQAPLLADLALPTALGITPWSARRIRECGEKDVFEPVWKQDRVKVGVLFHEAPEDCVGDSSCYHEFLLDERQQVEKLGTSVSWMSGTGPHQDLGLDWVQGVLGIGGPKCLLFPGMAFLPAVDHDSDPRSKDAWPWRMSMLGASTHIDHAEQFGQDVGGEFTVLAGDNIPAFSLKACPNLFLWECYSSGGGGGKEITEEDTVVLTLLLHRAVAMRSDFSSWSFHLPDLGIYSYVEGCTENGRVWSGESCSARILQEWSFNVYSRLVLNGLVKAEVP